MKKVMLLVSTMLFSYVLQAQNTPAVDARQQSQRARIHQGVTSGELTRPEASRLKAEQRHIRRSERRAKADGEVTAQERARINRKQNRASRDIRRQKHDVQDRPRAN